MYGLTELEKDRYIHYIGDGQSEYVTNFDSVAGTIFWNVYEKTRYSQPQIQACSKDIQVTYPVRLIGNIKRSLLECDSASSAEYLTLNLINILANQTNTLRKALGAKQILFEALASDDNVKGVKAHKDYITVAIDFKLVIIGTNECFNQNACIDFTNIPVIVEKVVCPTVQVDGENIPNQKLVNLISGENISITIGVNGEIIIASTSSGDVISVNGQTGVVVLDANDVGADPSGSAASALSAANNYTDTEISLITPASIGAYPDTNPSGFITAAQAPIQSVTGLDTDNTDPANPVIQIAVDGVTITGDGTAGNPLVGASSYALEILEDGVSVDANVDEINFKTPLKATQTAAGKVEITLQSGAITGAMYEIATKEALQTSRNAVLANGKLFIPSQISGNVRIFDSVTLDLLATISVSTPLECDYISYLDEVWVGTLSTGLITRIDATTNTIIATISDVQQNKRQFIEYLNPLSGNDRLYIITTQSVASPNGSSIRVYDLTTLTLITTIALTTGDTTIRGVLINNSASAMHRKIVLTGFAGTIGLRILDPETNTITASSIAPTGISAGTVPTYIDYRNDTDELAVTYRLANTIAIIQPATATTFTTIKIIGQILLPVFVKYDIVNNLLLAFTRSGFSTGVDIQFIKFNGTSYLQEGALKLNSTESIGVGSIQLLSNGTCCLVGVNANTGTSVFSIVKYV